MLHFASYNVASHFTWARPSRCYVQKWARLVELLNLYIPYCHQLSLVLTHKVIAVSITRDSHSVYQLCLQFASEIITAAMSSEIISLLHTDGIHDQSRDDGFGNNFKTSGFFPFKIHGETLYGKSCEDILLLSWLLVLYRYSTSGEVGCTWGYLDDGGLCHPDSTFVVRTTDIPLSPSVSLSTTIAGVASYKELARCESTKADRGALFFTDKAVNRDQIEEEPKHSSTVRDAETHVSRFSATVALIY